MATSRRQFLISTAWGIAAIGLPGCASISRPGPMPDPPEPRTFEPGDFLWPKPPGSIIPYESRPDNVIDERTVWETGKRQFIDSVKANPAASLEDRQAAAELEDITFNAFKRRYLLDAAPDTVDAFGSLASLLPVGHVGIVFFSQTGEPWIAEAMPSGVRLISYRQWRVDRRDQVVWHGRLNGVPRDKRALIAAEAIKYKGRPYGFFNFNLADISSFYCSKLAWLSTYRAIGLALDNNPNPWRRFWFSPKQVMKSPHVCLLYNPEPYASEARECAQASRPAT